MGEVAPTQIELGCDSTFRRIGTRAVGSPGFATDLVTLDPCTPNRVFINQTPGIRGYPAAWRPNKSESRVRDKNRYTRSSGDWSRMTIKKFRKKIWAQPILRTTPRVRNHRPAQDRDVTRTTVSTSTLTGIVADCRCPGSTSYWTG